MKRFDRNKSPKKRSVKKDRSHFGKEIQIFPNAEIIFFSLP
jgi:hypothetical protein